MNIEAFGTLTKERLKELGGYYVYALADPTDGGKIFYIGKGEGDRVFQHARAAKELEDEDVESLKLQTIRRILDAGKQVQTYILRHGLQEHEAFIVEAVIIDLLTNPKTANRCIDAVLHNIQGGHDQRELGIRTAEELDAQYSSEPLGYTNDKLIIININGTYKNRDIYEATRFCWRLSKRRADQADYILSEYHGVIRAVFKMDEQKWQPVPNQQGKSTRYLFTGYEVKDPEVLARYINKRIEKRHGDASPIHYLNIK